MTRMSNRVSRACASLVMTVTLSAFSNDTKPAYISENEAVDFLHQEIGIQEDRCREIAGTIKRNSADKICRSHLEDFTAKMKKVYAQLLLYVIALT